MLLMQNVYFGTAHKPVAVSPCSPSPCLPWEVCIIQGIEGALCKECVISSDCPAHMSCSAHQCKDPCPGVCGPGAECVVVSHSPVCRCRPGLLGDPYKQCSKPTRPVSLPSKPTLCVPSPCGTNARCQVKGDHEVCVCAPGYFGNPVLGCRPECVVHTDCDVKLACIRQQCVNPCPGTCAPEAHCSVVNHRPVCTCPADTKGDPLIRCHDFITLPSPIACKKRLFSFFVCLFVYLCMLHVYACIIYFKNFRYIFIYE